MTISQYITEFLKKYKNIEIETNHVADGSDKYGMFKSPARDVTYYNDDSYKVTEYFNFFAKQSAIAESERKESDEWLEDFMYWLDDYAIDNEYPVIDGDRRVLSITATGCPTPMYDDKNDITYQISMSITYEREVMQGQTRF